MLIGRYYHTLEAKGRLSLPKVFRQHSAAWVLTRGLDGGLFLLTPERFNQEVEPLSHSTLTNHDNRHLLRLMANNAQTVTVDGNGRISLPEYLIAAAQLRKEVVVVGSYSYLEIWDRQLYHQYLEKIESTSLQIAQRIHDQKELV